MSRSIVLDTGVLSLLTTKRGHHDGEPCRVWMASQLVAGVEFAVPKIADYELRRELLRASKTASVVRLDAFHTTIRYLPLTTRAVLKAAELWASTRNRGMPTAGNDALDGDVLICAQLLTTDWKGRSPIVATTNPSHLSQFVNAGLWQNIPIQFP